jgi:uncharacterized membrane protein
MFNDGLVGDKPKVTIKLSTSDKILEVIALLMLITIWIYVIYNYASLPEIINTHFNAQGKPDGSGEKQYIFGLPGVATFLYILTTITNKYPQLINHTEEITEENALEVYTKGTKIVRILKIIIVGVFGYASWQTIGNINVSPWFFPILLILTLSPIVYYNLKKK